MAEGQYFGSDGHETSGFPRYLLVEISHYEWLYFQYLSDNVTTSNEGIFINNLFSLKEAESEDTLINVAEGADGAGEQASQLGNSRSCRTREYPGFAAMLDTLSSSLSTTWCGYLFCEEAISHQYCIFKLAWDSTRKQAALLFQHANSREKTADSLSKDYFMIIGIHRWLECACLRWGLCMLKYKLQQLLMSATASQADSDGVFSRFLHDFQASKLARKEAENPLQSPPVITCSPDPSKSWATRSCPPINPASTAEAATQTSIAKRSNASRNPTSSPLCASGSSPPVIFSQPTPVSSSFRPLAKRSKPKHFKPGIDENIEEIASSSNVKNREEALLSAQQEGDTYFSSPSQRKPQNSGLYSDLQCRELVKLILLNESTENCFFLLNIYFTYKFYSFSLDVKYGGELPVSASADSEEKLYSPEQENNSPGQENHSLTQSQPTTTYHPPPTNHPPPTTNQPSTTQPQPTHKTHSSNASSIPPTLTMQEGGKEGVEAAGKDHLPPSVESSAETERPHLLLDRSTGSFASFTDDVGLGEGGHGGVRSTSFGSCVCVKTLDEWLFDHSAGLVATLRFILGIAEFDDENAIQKIFGKLEYFDQLESRLNVIRDAWKQWTAYYDGKTSPFTDSTDAKDCDSLWRKRTRFQSKSGLQDNATSNDTEKNGSEEIIKFFLDFMEANARVISLVNFLLPKTFSSSLSTRHLNEHISREYNYDNEFLEKFASSSQVEALDKPEKLSSDGPELNGATNFQEDTLSSGDKADPICNVLRILLEGNWFASGETREQCSKIYEALSDDKKLEDYSWPSIIGNKTLKATKLLLEAASSFEGYTMCEVPAEIPVEATTTNEASVEATEVDYSEVTIETVGTDLLCEDGRSNKVSDILCNLNERRNGKTFPLRQDGMSIFDPNPTEKRLKWNDGSSESTEVAGEHNISLSGGIESKDGLRSPSEARRSVKRVNTHRGSYIIPERRVVAFKEKWSDEQKNELIKLVEKIGIGKWEQIKKASVSLSSKSGSQLKDKWRNLTKNGQVGLHFSRGV